ncbi:MAG: DUF3226 domain-containing protein [Methylococcus sp.]
MVEGKNDLHVMLSLCGQYDMPETFEIVEKEGIENVLETLEAEIAGSFRESIGMIVDADTDLESRWTSICSILSRYDYSPPKNPGRYGTILAHDSKPMVGVWLMPDNHLPGELEDFIAFLVPDKEPGSLWTHAAQSMDRLPASLKRFTDQDRSKAHIHTWLAWQREPGKPLGQAITARYLDATVPNAQHLMQWLKDLFIQTSQTVPT